LHQEALLAAQPPDFAFGRFRSRLQRLGRFDSIATKVVEAREQSGLGLFGAWSEFVRFHRFLHRIRLLTPFRAASEKSL
jgi:hypothetical protein